MAAARAYLVETIPQGLEDLAGPDTHHTAAVLRRLVAGARHTIDLTAVYWNLLHHPQSLDEAGFSAAEIATLGAGRGRQLYEELLAAAARGVQIRIVQGPGFLPEAESAALVRRHPQQIVVRQVEMDNWYGGGVLHQKLWLVDGRHLYLGSANMDWRSLTQVKELGLAVEDDPAVVADLSAQFTRWWQFAALDPAPVLVADPEIALTRPVPAWSPLLPATRRRPAPFSPPPSAPPPSLSEPLRVEWNGRPGTVYSTGSPPALCAPGRTRDIDALRHTIDQARERVSIEVMHFAPLSVMRNFHAGDAAEPLNPNAGEGVWWPALANALLRAVCRGVEVRLLIGRWPHSPDAMLPHLRALVQIARACTAEPAGGLEVRLFTIPGWDSTLGAGRRYPGHSRVNHPKFIVTEQRLNVGTSNMSWGDFAWNGGISLNTDHPDLVAAAQAIFDRDWASDYALPP